jgi:polysaccharide export outer membrane protein
MNDTVVEISISHSEPRRPLLTRGRDTAVMVLLLITLFGAAQAQQAEAGGAAGAPRDDATTAHEGALAADQYRLGPGDILDIRILNRPQLSREAVRIEGNGSIRMPLVDGDIEAACKTEGELAREIASRYLKYLRNPQVEVFVKEFNSKPVAVIGAVNSPGRFQLQRRVRLLELLTFAGGPAERAGRSVQVVHNPTAQRCGMRTTAEKDDIRTEAADAYMLSSTLGGEDSANPYVHPGDVITVPDSDQVYVVGNVLRPMTIPLKDPITVSQAIAMAGGLMPDTKTDRIRIVRQLPGATTKKELYVDLKAIEKHQADDVGLQANDIVDIPTSSGKRFLRSLLGTVVPSISQMPVRVIR